ncbi:EamA family transporter [Bacillus clarus]|uniref:EamA family transporter n=1 Tax=Bacillus clarus TaxID=2338372 RepID=A0A090YUC5_9BACI|nr:DMT family transporter [Bacillus clarus]KFM95665.1 eamA-like transporter family protein [Bacillus clarus]RFT62874.1 EamA family transporter [Bacillus clarus]
MKLFNTSIFVSHLFIIVLWASAFPGIRLALTGYSPESLSLLRLLIGSFGLIIFAIATRMKLPQVKDIPVIIFFGGLGFTGYYLALNHGEKFVNAGTASLLVSLTPIFTAILAWVIFRERIGLWKWVGGIVAFSGVALLSLGYLGGVSFHKSALFILIASLVESLYFVLQKPYLKKYGFLPFTCYTIWGGTLLMLIFLPELWNDFLNAPQEATWSAVYLGVFPTVIPYIALGYLTAKRGASEATSSLYLTPLLSFIIAWIWLGEVPNFTTILGGIIIIAGILLTILQTDEVKVQEKKESFQI